jgi:predicted lactoylglutathione lyase
MHKQVIFNLPVKDLEKSKAFFASLGFGFDPKVSGDHAAMVVIEEGAISAMLMTEAFFTSLTGKAVAQAKDANEVIICLMCDSRDEVAGLVDKAVAAGGRTPHPLEDEGFMVSQGFEDLDGHLWNLVWMNPQASSQ